MPSTLVHALLPAACVMSRKPSVEGLTRRQIGGLALSCAVIGNLPDLDVIGVILMPEYGRFIHRNVGHNFLALTLWIIVGRWMLGLVDKSRFDCLRAYVYSGALVMSHVFLDSGCVHSDGVPAGVPILWPLSDWSLVSPFPFFSDYVLNDRYHWFMGHLLAVDFWRRAVFQELWVSLTIWLGFVGMDRITRRLLGNAATDSQPAAAFESGASPDRHADKAQASS